MTKRILTMMLAIMLVISMALSLVSCAESETKKKYTNKSYDESVESVATSAESYVEQSSIFSGDAVSTPSAEEFESSFVSEESEDADIQYSPDGFLEFVDWGGTEVNFLCRDYGETSYITYQVDAEEASDNPVLNAFYRRNQYIKQNFNLDINVIHPESGEDIVEMLKTDIMAGGHNYQGIVHPIYYVAPLAVDGLLKDFKSISNGYVRLDKEYWDQALIRDVAIKDKVFFLSGDAIVGDDESTWVMFFNKDVVEEYSLENPYDLVRNNEWTIDKMYEMAQQYELTNGAVKSYDPYVGDKWGMVVQSYDFYQFMMAADQRMVDNTGDVPVLRVDDQENITTFNKIANWFIFDSKNIGVADFHGRWDSGVYDQETQIFANGNALFMPNAINTVNGQNLRETEVNYGVVPLPKRSELQENYAAGVNAYNYDVIAVPYYIQGEELDATCYALEAMAFFGKELVTPEYYDRTLVHKILKDEESVEMLDIIFSNRVFDMGYVINFNAGVASEGTLYFYPELIGAHSDAISSQFKMRKNAYQRGIDNFVAQCNRYLG